VKFNKPPFTHEQQLDQLIQRGKPVCKSVGVQAVSHMECTAQALTVIEDGNPHPEHCSVDFTALDKKTIEKKSKLLRAQAETRGWLFREAVA
jgi:hypothetical protein